MSLLDPDLIIERARLFARSDDFFGERWVPAFRALLEAVDAEARLRPGRRERFASELVQLLVTRSRTAAALRAHPEIASLSVPGPVVISGLPRTGTTLLHNLLALLPGNRSYRLWELRAPAFPSGAPLDQPRRERDAAREALAWIESRAPIFRTIHPMDADAPDECNFLLRPTFTTPVFAWTNHVPSYERWLLESADRRAAYEEWKLGLQLLRFRSPGGMPVLKDPGHLESLDVLLDVCPDARVLILSRDLAECVPSLASLCHTLQSIESDAPSKESVGALALGAAQRGLAALARARELHPEKVLTVPYTSLVGDPVATVGTIQASLGRLWDEEGRRRCLRFLEANRRVAPLPHRYTLEEFGLAAADLPVP